MKIVALCTAFLFCNSILPAMNPAGSATSMLGPGSLVSLADTVYVQLSGCSNRAEVCMDISLNDIGDFQIFENSQPYSSGIAGCDFDTASLYSYSNLYGQGAGGPYILNNWKVNNSIFSAPFNTIDELVDSMNVWDPLGNWANDSFLKGVFGGNPANTYEDMVIFVVAQGSPTVLPLDDLIVPKGTGLNFSTGIHEIELIETSSGIRDTFVVFASCITSTTLYDTVMVQEADTICLDFSELPADVDAVFNACGSNGSVDFQLTNGDSCLIFSGLQPGSDTACLVACDRLGLCDTTFFMIEVPASTGYHEYYDTLYEHELDMLCLNTLVFTGQVDTIFNSCDAVPPTFAKFEIDSLNYCISYGALMAGGTSVGCIVMCDDLGDCDTTIMHITVRRQGPMYVYDSLFVNTTATFCDLDTSNLNGTLTQIQNFCPSNSMDFVDFQLDTINYCIHYTGSAPGTDTACILLLDDAGGMDTTYLVVSVLLPQTDWIYDTLRPGLTAEYCLDTTELGGLVADTAFLCEDFSGTSISWDRSDSGLCFEVKAVLEGTDTICLYICDDGMVCDTTYFVITVDSLPPGALPQANNDATTTDFNTPITVDVLANDTIPIGGLSNFFILPVTNGGAGPLHGTAVMFSDESIQYIPDTGFCGAADVISYVICNDLGCDTAELSITVNCLPSELSFFSGFSPNGDGVNDSFVIEGIEAYPDHILYVFNRWGNLVLETANYRNDWEGTWEGNVLPEGTYFYLLKMADGTNHHGYVIIHR